MFRCFRRDLDEIDAYYPFEEEHTVSPRSRFAWFIMGIVYLGSMIFNAVDQKPESWGGYAFKMTQISAWLTLVQHLVHPYSPVKDKLLSLGARLPIGRGPWRCIKDDNYTHAEGLSNLGLTLEGLATVMYWTLSTQIDETYSPADRANSVLMHGGISATILMDYFVNERPYHLRHTLVNLAIFQALYTGWNYAGQRINTVPVYPDMDWIEKPINILYALLLGAACSLVITGLLKLMTCLRRGEYPEYVDRHCPFLRNRANAAETGASAGTIPVVLTKL